MKKRSFILLLGLAASPAPALATERSDSGPALHAGVGDHYGGLGAGVAAEYQFALVDWLRLSPFASAGVLREEQHPMYGFGWAAGAHLELGYYHRLFFGPSYGTHYVDARLQSDGSYRQVGVTRGPTLLVGYKGLARSGLLWQLSVGAYCLPRPEAGITLACPAPAFSAGLGYKF